MITFPDNFTVLIDGGPDETILNYLAKDINPIKKHINMVILSHAHKDHYGGLIPVMREYSIDILILNKSQYEFLKNSPEFSPELLTGSLVLSGYKGDNLVCSGGVNNNKCESSLSVVWPPNPDNTSYSRDRLDPNADSLMLLLKFKNFSAVLMSDNDLSALEAITLQNVDIFKVPHQGSKYSYSPQVYEKLKPKVAVISVGNNSYGHPSDDVIEAIEYSGARVFRTDKLGTVTVRTNGDFFEIVQD